jgi:flagellar assembly factor FliW
MTTVIDTGLAGGLRLLEPLPGFDGHHAFTLAEIDPDGVLLSLRSKVDPELRFVLTPAECFFPGYRPELGDDVVRALTDEPGDPVRLLLVLTLGAGLADATANMRAPIVLGAGSRRATQVVLDDESLSMRQPLLERARP